MLTARPCQHMLTIPGVGAAAGAGRSVRGDMPCLRNSQLPIGGDPALRGLGIRRYLRHALWWADRLVIRIR
jgi:hypothetical protein